MTEQKKLDLDALIHLHQNQVARFNKRRDLEWRLTFTLWGGLALSATLMKDIELPEQAVPVAVVLLAAVVVFHIVWQKLYMVRSAEPNRDLGIKLENMIRREVGIEEVQPQRYIRWAAHYWQIGVTIMLALLVLAVFMWQPASPAG